MAGDTVQAGNWIGAVKTETTHGVDAFGGAAPTEFFRFRKLDIINEIDSRRDAAGTATDTPEASVPIPRGCKVSWEAPLFPAHIEAGNTSHALQALLNSCKLKAVADDGVDIRYSPYSANDMANTPSATFAKYEFNSSRQAKKILGRGVRSIPEIVIEPGQISYVKGEGKGMYTEEPSSFSAAPALPTDYNDELVGMACTKVALTSDSDGIEWRISKATIKSGLNHKELMTGDGAGSVGAVLLVKPDTGSPYVLDFTLEEGFDAIADLIARLKSGAPVDFALLLQHGGRSSELVIPAGQIKAAAKQRSGTQSYQAQLEFVRANGTAGDNDFEWIFS